jgi:hypothetical protein
MYPTPETEAAAKLAPSSILYAIEGNYGPHDAFPLEAVKGAWQVDAAGNIVGAFIPNPNFVRGKAKSASQYRV